MRNLPCRYCRATIEQAATGRPRTTCPRPECQRAAEADRKARRRRRLAGVPLGIAGIKRYPRGGRDPLVRRLARQIVARRYRRVRPSVEEWAMLDMAVRAGMTVSTPAVLIEVQLTPAARQLFRRLVKRNREADPQYRTRHDQRAASGGGRQRGAYDWRAWASQWLGLRDPGSRDNVFEELLEQVPPERRQSVYRGLARSLHPDTGGSAELMTQLNAAYAKLSGADGS